MTRTSKTLLSVTLIVAALATGLTLPASAEMRTVTVRMADGTVQSVVLDVPAETTLEGMADLVAGEPLSYAVIEEPLAPAVPVQGAQPAREPAPPPATPPAAPQLLLPASPAPTELPQEGFGKKDRPRRGGTLTEPTGKAVEKPKKLTLE